ncbi:hypothetical protein Tco_1547822 [Tanacetum coccineum]
MTGVPRHVAEHRLNVREGCPPVRQKKRSQAPERNKAIQEEVEKLVTRSIISKEVPLNHSCQTQQVDSNHQSAGRLQKWSIELGEYDINYRQRVSIKGQILADFIVEQPEDDSLAAQLKFRKSIQIHGH